MPLVWGLLTGCAYREAMERGQQAVQQQDWPAAVAAYEAALAADPEDEHARSALAATRRLWHHEALAAFHQALARGDLGAAGTALRSAERAAPDDAATGSARQALTNAQAAREAGTLRAEAEKASQSGDLRGAFRLAARAERVHGTPEGQRQLDATRSRLIEEARAEEAAGRWRAADALHETLASEAPAHTPERAAFRTRWADHERARGEAAGADLGAALVHFAQAAALAQRPEDAAKRDTLRQALLRETAPVLVVDEQGARTPHLRQALDALPPSPGGPQAPRLTVTLEAGVAECRQSKQTRVAEGQFVAGTRDVPNPAWQHARNEVARLRDELRRAENDEARARSDLHEAERRLRKSAQEHRERIRREREAAHRGLERAREGERRAQDALRQAHDRRDEGEIRRKESDLDRARAEVDRAWQLLDAVAEASQRSSAESDRDRAHDAFTRAEEERHRRRDRLYEAEQRLDAIPPTREEPRYATHRYPVHRWQRTCTRSARLVARLPGLPDLTRDVAGEAHTADESHEVQLPLNLDEDPLRFPEDDAALLAQIDGHLGQEAAKVAKSQQNAWAAALADRAGESTKWAVASLLLDRTGARPLVKARLAELGLVDFGVLWAEGP